jgi:hypothetical protein
MLLVTLSNCSNCSKVPVSYVSRGPFWCSDQNCTSQ